MTQEERNAWLAERKTGIGGSEVAAILGLSPWATPVTVWLDKTGRSAPKEENEAMRIGTELEDFVARRYCQETGNTVQRFTKMIHKGCMLGNFDRLVVPHGAKVASHMGEIRTDTLLECKTGSREWEDGVPLYYQTQVLWYLGLEPKLQHADVAYLNLNYKHFEIHRVERDDEVIKTLQERAQAWWVEHIVNDKIPEPMNEVDCKLLWAKSNPGKKVTATSETVELIESLKKVKDDYDRISEDKKKLESDIKAKFGDAEVLVGLDGKPLATWKSSKDKEVVDWKAIAAEFNPTKEIIAKHTTLETGSRRFLLKSA